MPQRASINKDDIDSKPVFTFAQWRVKEGQLAGVLNLVADLTAKSRAEEGSLVYEIYQGTSDENTLILFEGYKDESALTVHRNSDHFQNLVIEKDERRGNAGHQCPLTFILTFFILEGSPIWQRRKSFTWVRVAGRRRSLECA